MLIQSITIKVFIFTPSHFPHEDNAMLKF